MLDCHSNKNKKAKVILKAKLLYKYGSPSFSDSLIHLQSNTFLSYIIHNNIHKTCFMTE